MHIHLAKHDGQFKAAESKGTLGVDDLMASMSFVDDAALEVA
jgi:hypothetical protein